MPAFWPSNTRAKKLVCDWGQHRQTSWHTLVTPLQGGNMLKHILLVDDEEMVGEALKDYLEFSGYSVLYTTNGAAALELAAQQQQAGSPFDVGISDVRMPGIDGVTLSRELNQRYKLPMLLVSGYPLEVERMQTYGTRILGLFRKPFSLNALTDKLKEVLSSQE